MTLPPSLKKEDWLNMSMYRAWRKACKVVPSGVPFGRVPWVTEQTLPMPDTMIVS